jgi:hypothetical protein
MVMLAEAEEVLVLEMAQLLEMAEMAEMAV